MQNPDGTTRVQTAERAESNARGRWGRGVEFQNKKCLPGSAIELFQRSTKSLWAAVSGPLGAGRRALAHFLGAGATVEPMQQCSDSGLGQLDGVTASLLGRLAPPPAANWGG